MVMRPWMPLYVADYLADTTHLSAAEHGAYLLLIMHYWQTGALPQDDRKLARIARMSDREWKDARETVAEFFDSEWRHRRIDKELSDASEKYERRALAGQKGGNARAKRVVNGRPEDSNASSNASVQVSNAAAMPVALLNQPQPQLLEHLDSDNLPAAQQAAARERSSSPSVELDRVQALCSSALGDRAPTDVVIGPMAERFRKFGERRVLETLASEARKSRRSPVKTWRLWATIVDESLGPDAPSSAPARAPEDPSDPLVDLGGTKRRESEIRKHLAAWLNDKRKNSWNVVAFGFSPDDPGCRVPTAILAEFGLQRVPYPVDDEAVA